MIIDRDAQCLVHLAGLISAHGLAVQSAGDLDEALETLREEPKGCLLVLLAARVSARETCDTIIRLSKENQAQAIAVAVMGDALAEAQSDACRAAGALAFLPTPVAPAALQAVLAALPTSGGTGSPQP